MEFIGGLILGIVAGFFLCGLCVWLIVRWALRGHDTTIVI